MPVDIFFSYAHADEALLNKLKLHLTPLSREGLIDLLWHDRNISAGTEWEREIDTYLNKVQIILLLVSPDFMASDYCYSVEMQRAIKRHEKGEARAIPVILRHAQWKKSPIGKLQAVPTDGKPVKSWQDEDEAFFIVVEGIRKAIGELSVHSHVSIPLPDTSEATPSTALPLNKGEQEETIIDAVPNQLAIATTPVISPSPSSAEPIEDSASSQLPQNKVDLQEVLTKFRKRLAEMEIKIELGSSSQMSEAFAVELHSLLREIISTIRTMPQERSVYSSNEYFKSKDDVLENLRQARIQVMMAINSIPLLFRIAFDGQMPETFYQCLMSCREYLERTLKHW